jgi:hypothetical protein
MRRQLVEAIASLVRTDDQTDPGGVQGIYPIDMQHRNRGVQRLDNSKHSISNRH